MLIAHDFDIFPRRRVLSVDGHIHLATDTPTRLLSRVQSSDSLVTTADATQATQHFLEAAPEALKHFQADAMSVKQQCSTDATQAACALTGSSLPAPEK